MGWCWSGIDGSQLCALVVAYFIVHFVAIDWMVGDFSSVAAKAAAGVTWALPP